ncbi:hypothetical protein [Priestia flexa]|uniref:hypothetical protein n=1 Tax=Priestia flexa TaxID=86664 RepID=UPI000473CAAA|nr:hypothetical protein [Priestia flexa]
MKKTCTGSLTVSLLKDVEVLENESFQEILEKAYEIFNSYTYKKITIIVENEDGEKHEIETDVDAIVEWVDAGDIEE